MDKQMEGKDAFCSMCCAITLFHLPSTVRMNSVDICKVSTTVPGASHPMC